MHSKLYLAFALSAGLCFSSLADVGDWGVRYEVNDGSGWNTALTIDASNGPVALDFRISVYHDGQMIVRWDNSGGVTITPEPAPGFAVAPLRLCMSQRITNFGTPGSGDSVVSYRAAVSHYNAKSLIKSQSGPDMILGTPNSVYSFASNLSYAFSPDHAPALQTPYFLGKMQIGSGSSRTITITANTFAYPNAVAGNGGIYGGSFYTDPARAIWGAAPTPAVVIPAIITVAMPCPSDFDGSRTVDDSDFDTFLFAHDLTDCAAPGMPADCAADLNGDGSVDDADFAIFAVAYDALVCS